MVVCENWDTPYNNKSKLLYVNDNGNNGIRVDKSTN